MQPQVCFGIQIKSYKDIQKKSLAGQVHEQISRSHKHNLSKLMLALAGDMNDISQNPKVSGIVSEIHQNKGDNDYVIVIPPQQALTIHRVYKEQQHPLKFIKLDLQRASELSIALGESLSNDFREAKISMHIEYKKMDNDNYPIRIKLKHMLRKGELGLLDQLEQTSAADQSIKIPKEKVKEFQVYENDKPILADDVKSDLVITRENLVVPLVLQTISENGDTIKSLDQLNFIVKEKDGQFVYEFFDKDHPLSIKIPASISINLEFSRGNVVVLESAIGFLQSLSSAKKLRIKNINSSKDSTADVNANNSVVFNSKFISLIKALAIIQRKIGYLIRYPENPQRFTDKEFYHIFDVANWITNGQISLKGINATIEVPRIQALLLLDEYEKQGELRDLSFRREQMMTEKVLDQDIRLGPAEFYAAKVRPIGDIAELRKKFMDTKNETVELEAESLEGQCRK
jgi:hypothetical protein